MESPTLEARRSHHTDSGLSLRVRSHAAEARAGPGGAAVPGGSAAAASGRISAADNLNPILAGRGSSYCDRRAVNAVTPGPGITKSSGRRGRASDARPGTVTRTVPGHTDSGPPARSGPGGPGWRSEPHWHCQAGGPGPDVRPGRVRIPPSLRPKTGPAALEPESQPGLAAVPQALAESGTRLG
jgi:hypothetical protein